LAFTRRIPGLRSETWGTHRVSMAELVWGSGFGFRVFPQALYPPGVQRFYGTAAEAVPFVEIRLPRGDQP
jgi:hypothetical protein